MRRTKMFFLHFGIALLATATIALAAPCFAGPCADTDDGLYVRYRESGGEVVALMHCQTPVELRLVEPDYAGFSVTDVAHPERSQRLDMTIKEVAPDAFTLETEDATVALRVRVTVTGDAACVRYVAEVEDLSGKERALTLRHQVPVQADGWLWWDDVVTSRVIEPERRYVRYDRDEPGRFPMCWYPFGTIAQPGVHALTWAVPLEPPMLARPGYDGDFFIEFDFGLSPHATKMPGRARLSWVLYTSDPAWGMRAALKKYYDLYPTAFTKRVNREGLWLARTPTQALAHPDDFGITFHQMSSVKANPLPYDNPAGIYAFLYDEPSRWNLRLEPGQSASDGLTKALKDPGDPQHDKAALIERVAARTPDGGYYSEPFPGGARGTVMTFEANVDPDMPTDEATGRSRLEQWWSETSPQILGVREGRLDGVYIDSSEARVDSTDFNRAHFAYTDSPLVWTPESARPGVSTAVATFEYLQVVGERLRAQGKLLMANFTPYRHAFFVPLFDVLGTEVWLDGEDWVRFASEQLRTRDGRKRFFALGGTEAELDALTQMTSALRKQPRGELAKISWKREDLMYYRRALCYQKPYSLLLKLMDEKDVFIFGEDGLSEYMDWCVFFGIYPGCSEGLVKCQDQLAPIYRRYMPVARALGMAGWEPVTHAATDSPTVRVERFGYASQGTLHFTVRNFSPKAQDVVLRIDSGALMLAEDVLVRDAFTNEIIRQGGTETDWESEKDPCVRLTMSAGQTRVLRAAR